jgi:hypothetical protein
VAISFDSWASDEASQEFADKRDRGHDGGMGGIECIFARIGVVFAKLVNEALSRVSHLDISSSIPKYSYRISKNATERSGIETKEHVSNEETEAGKYEQGGHGGPC